MFNPLPIPAEERPSLRTDIMLKGPANIYQRLRVMFKDATPAQLYATIDVLYREAYEEWKEKAGPWLRDL